MCGYKYAGSGLGPETREAAIECTHTHTRTQTHAHAHIHTKIYTHTHIHMHVHTHPATAAATLVKTFMSHISTCRHTNRSMYRHRYTRSFLCAHTLMQYSYCIKYLEPDALSGLELS